MSKNHKRNHRTRRAVYFLLSLASFVIAILFFNNFSNEYSIAHDGLGIFTDKAGNVLSYAMIGIPSLVFGGVAAITGLVFLYLALKKRRKKR